MQNESLKIIHDLLEWNVDMGTFDSEVWHRAARHYAEKTGDIDFLEPWNETKEDE